MMQKSKSQSSDLLRSMNFPTAGETLNGARVISSDAKLEGDILKYEVVLPRGTKTKQVPAILNRFFTTQVIPSESNLIVRHHDYTVKPKGENVAVVGAMHVLPVVRANPSVQEFDEEYSKMEMTNPETYFRKHECGPINSPQFRAKMFTLVSMMGENYGYGLKGCVYHRRASLIMPKIKITKAVPQAEMMYHTHPKKDEPSLSSPDDYLLYFDLSHNPRSIRHFYTVMKDRMDYFHITPKKNSKENFLKLNEDKIIDELDAEMTALEKKWDKKMPRNGNYEEDLRYCENITRDFVKFLNSKYGKYFSIKYKCYYKVKKNPPEPELEDLHLNDELLDKSIDSIKARDYTWTPEVKEKAHEGYVYWHHLRSLDTLAGSAKTLGISPQGSHKRTYARYMNKAFEDTQYNYADALNILNLAHDISMADSKIRDAGGLTSRMKELCEYLEVSETGTETLQMLEEVIHNQNLFTEEAMTLTGDYYGLALLSSYAIQAVGAIEQVKKGKKQFNLVEYEIYTNLKSETQTRFQDFLVGEKDARGYAFGENAPIAQGFVDSFLNPPQLLKKKVEFEHQFPAETFAYDYDLVAEALDKFNVEKYDPKKNFFVRGQFYLRFPTTFGKVSMSITQSTGKAQIFVTGRPEPMQDALDAVTQVGTRMVRYGLPGIDPEEYDVQTIDAAQNPQTAQVIAIAGPSGSGKSTTIRNLLSLLPKSKTVPTVTTRKQRKSDKKGERVFVSTEQFKKEMREGDMVAAQLQKNGNYYGRRKSDFEGANYVIVDVNLKGINAIKRAYPNTFTIYLEPVEDPEFIRKRLLRRGDMSPQEAKGRASIIPSHIRDSKMIDFDARIKTKQGEFSKIALELEPMIPKSNPKELVRQIFNDEDEVQGEDKTLVVYGDVYNLERGSIQRSNVTLGDRDNISGNAIKAGHDVNTGTQVGGDQNSTGRESNIVHNPPREKPTLEEFRKWVELVNMKNKELQAFMKSDWFKVSGLTPAQAKAQGIKSGQDSFRAIIRMRKKLGLTGPKDYIKEGPQITKKYYEMALDKWSGPDNTVSALDDRSDWGWMKRQIRFNSRASAFPYNKAQEKRKGPLVKKQKTQNQPSRKLLSLWVWGHDPWRWARKHGVANMPKCPDVPWVGMTEKRKYGKIPVMMSPRTNPSNIPFPIPEEYQDELETRLAEEMTRPGYRPHTIPEVIEEGLYDDSPSDFSYAQGEYEEFLEEIEKGDFDEAYAEYSDVEGHVAYWLYTNHRVIMPIYAQSHLAKTRGRIQIFKDLFEHYGYEHSPAYLKGGSNYEKVFKVRAALDAAADAQGKPRITDNDDQLISVVKNIVEARKNPRIPKKYEGQDPSEHSDLYTDEDPRGTIQGLGFKDKATAEKSVNIIKRSGKTHAHKIQAAMAMEQRARFHPNATPGIKAAQKVYAKFIEEMKEKTKEMRKNPPQVYYHGSPVDNIKVLRKGSYVSPDYQTAYDMGRYHLDTKKSWTDEDLAIPMDWGTRPTFKKGREPKGIPTVYTVKLYDDDLVELGVDEDGVNWEYQTSIEAPVVRLGRFAGDKPTKNPRKFSGIKEAHEHYNYPGSHRTGTIIKDGVVIRTYSNNTGHDIVKDDGDTIQYMIKTPKIRTAFLATRKQGKPLRFFLKTGANEVTDMGMYEVGRLSGKFVNLTKATKSNPSRTPEGRKIPKKYLKGLNKEEMIIAAKEIDKGYKYDVNDPKAYEEWQSDIKAKARGYKTVPSKYKKKFIEMYGPLPKKGKFLDKVAKATKIKKSILKKVYDKGLAAWATGHRVGVAPHQWASGRVYSFVTLGKTVKKGNKKMPDYSLAVEAGLVKEKKKKNPSEWRHGEFAEDDPFEEYFEA